MQTTFSSETIGCLRNCILQDKGTYEGKTFIRCIPFAPGVKLLPEAEARAQVLRVVSEVNEPGVKLSWHQDFGDYVRVETDTKTFRFICQMKS